MNQLDKIIGYFSPRAALDRERARKRLELVQNSGYGNYGASRLKKAMKGWIADGGSAAEDIHENLSTLRVRSRDLYMGVPLATGALKSYRTNVVGGGLPPKPVIDGEALHMTEEQADALEKQISREFSLWADSTNCDAERMSNIYELQQLAFINWIMSGDVFALLQMKEWRGPLTPSVSSWWGRPGVYAGGICTIWRSTTRSWASWRWTAPARWWPITSASAIP